MTHNSYIMEPGCSFFPSTEITITNYCWVFAHVIGPAKETLARFIALLQDVIDNTSIKKRKQSEEKETETKKEE